jgi:hypothetical protein
MVAQNAEASRFSRTSFWENKMPPIAELPPADQSIAKAVRPLLSIFATSKDHPVLLDMTPALNIPFLNRVESNEL